MFKINDIIIVRFNKTDNEYILKVIKSLKNNKYMVSKEGFIDRNGPTVIVYRANKFKIDLNKIDRVFKIPKIMVNFWIINEIK